MGESSSKVACVAFRDLNVFPMGIKVESLVYSVYWLAFMVCNGDLDLMVACDGFYDGGLVMTLWWFYDDGLVVPCGGF